MYENIGVCVRVRVPVLQECMDGLQEIFRLILLFMLRDHPNVSTLLFSRPDHWKYLLKTFFPSGPPVTRRVVTAGVEAH